MLSVKQGAIKYHFLFFDMTQPGIEPWSLGPLANTLPTILEQIKYVVILAVCIFNRIIDSHMVRSTGEPIIVYTCAIGNKVLLLVFYNLKVL